LGEAHLQSDQTLEKNLPKIWKKVAKTITKPKKQNTYIKALFESPKHLHQTTFETLKYPQQTIL
jgi:hypothetical protein